MALNPSSMVSGFLEIAKNPPPSPAEAAKRYAKVYNSYAQTAMALSALPVFTGLEVIALQESLFAAMANPAAGLPATLALAWGAGLVAYWNAPPVAFVGAQTGTVLQAATALAIAVPALTAIFAIPLNTAQTCALGMATARILATRTITVTLVPPPGTVAPLL